MKDYTRGMMVVRVGVWAVQRYAVDGMVEIVVSCVVEAWWWCSGCVGVGGTHVSGVKGGVECMKWWRVVLLVGYD